jgi:two-component system chemotaxis response regulator CheY
MTHFLVVDDSAIIRRVARRMLEELGFSVSEAEDGLVALNACQAKMPDAVLLDWNMPRMDGLSFLKALRSSPAGRSPKVLLCTTENGLDHVTQALQAGANEYLFKPFDQTALASKLVLAGVAA